MKVMGTWELSQAYYYEKEIYLFSNHFIFLKWCEQYLKEMEQNDYEKQRMESVLSSLRRLYKVIEQERLDMGLSGAFDFKLFLIKPQWRKLWDDLRIEEKL